MICSDTKSPRFAEIRAKMIQIANKRNYSDEQLVGLYLDKENAKKPTPIKLGRVSRGRHPHPLTPKTKEERESALKDFQSYHRLR